MEGRAEAVQYLFVGTRGLIDPNRVGMDDVFGVFEVAGEAVFVEEGADAIEVGRTDGGFLRAVTSLGSGGSVRWVGRPQCTRNFARYCLESI